jgi:DNA-directed RNA polymerase subunit RPC12/RpoP
MPAFLTLNCPSCGAKTNILPGTERYICDYCGSEHLLQSNHDSNGFDKPSTTCHPTSAKKRMIVPQPQSVRITQDRQKLRLVRRWFSWKYIPLVFFCIAWDSFLLFWYSIAFSTNSPWIMIVFPIAHVAVGIGLTYSTLAGLINRTVVEVTPKFIEIWHEPLPWLGEGRYPTSQVTQLYSTEQINRGNDTVTRQYLLHAITQDGRQINLISNLESPDVALFIEQRIESWLKISDQPVAGEFT